MTNALIFVGLLLAFIFAYMTWKLGPPMNWLAYFSTKWYVANPDKRRIHINNRRGRVLASGQLSPDLVVKLTKLQRGKCACCGKPLGTDYHLDHIMPIALGGSNTDDNMQLLRKMCNLQKHAKHPVDFMQQRGFLL